MGLLCSSEEEQMTFWIFFRDFVPHIQANGLYKHWRTADAVVDEDFMCFPIIQVDHFNTLLLIGYLFGREERSDSKRAICEQHGLMGHKSGTVTGGFQPGLPLPVA